MTTTILSNVKTGEIRIGDIVLTHGMRVRIDEIRTYPGDAWRSPRPRPSTPASAPC